MGQVVYAGAHLGYCPAQVPLGGGAQVGIRLIERWAATGRFPVTVLGSGPQPPLPPGPHVAYRQIPWQVPGHRGPITDLTVSGYARFSRQFERGVTEFLRRAAQAHDPRRVCVVHNDICEAGDFAAIARLGYSQVAIFHVDVVDYAARIYLRGAVSAAFLARAFRGVARARLTPLLPDVARLILEKQQACARHCQLLVVPSPAMAAVLQSAYPWRTQRDVAVVPWGIVSDPHPLEEDVRRAEEALRARYQVEDDQPVLLTLSRVAPEKGQDLLLAALRRWERAGGPAVRAFICGAPAFIHGRSYWARLHRLARRLRRVRVDFPGHVTGAEKAAFFRLADLYVFPSRHESYGLTLGEALAAGLPVLTTAHRSAGQLVRPQIGRVVPPTPQGLLDGLCELLTGDADLEQMGRAARAFARHRPFPAAADQLADAIRGLLDGQPPAAAPIT
ncbi:MAG: glycosyltransferase family 4 protein [Candidatus Bipolaricaulaceae bacterium]